MKDITFWTNKLEKHFKNKLIKKATGKVALVNLDKLNFKTKIKQVIVYLACLGLMPFGLASWLISVGGLKHE